MSHFMQSSIQSILAGVRSVPRSKADPGKPQCLASAKQAASITKDASLQTYLTIRHLVDSELVDDAYRAYAYFRWVDDILDGGQLDQVERLSFLTRQQELIGRSYHGQRPQDLCQEEILVVDLIKNEQARRDQVRYVQDVNNGLRKYIDHMMAVMAFDSIRKDQFISHEELARYTHHLAVAVTEAMHYFIGHDDYAPLDETRYAAVTGAHITHMLRDALEDAEVGYYNVPGEYLSTYGITPSEVSHEAFRAWVSEQVILARSCFDVGRDYMACVENLRCRLAGYAYFARFEHVLDAIENEGYLLRAAYPELKTNKARIKMTLAAAIQTIRSSLQDRQSPIPSFASSMEIPR